MRSGRRSTPGTRPAAIVATPGDARRGMSGAGGTGTRTSATGPVRGRSGRPGNLAYGVRGPDRTARPASAVSPAWPGVVVMPEPARPGDRVGAVRQPVPLRRAGGLSHGGPAPVESPGP